jgi:hypothetical protein
VGLNGTLIEAKIFTFSLECRSKFHFQELSHLDPRRCNFPDLALVEPNGLQCGIKMTDDKSGCGLMSGVVFCGTACSLQIIPANGRPDQVADEISRTLLTKRRQGSHHILYVNKAKLISCDCSFFGCIVFTAFEGDKR